MLKIKCDINQKDLKRVDLHFFSNSNNFHSLGVVDRVSETQLQVGENSISNNLAVKGFSVCRESHQPSEHKTVTRG